MIQNNYYNWFNHPSFMNIELNPCSYKCSYCYSKQGSTLKEFKIKEVLNLINKSKSDQSNLQKFMLNRGYLVCLSNMTDPFCENNIENTEIIVDALTENGNNILFQTKGGDNEKISAILSKDSKNILYVTIETLRDAKRKELAPNAPTINSRIELLKWYNSIGGQVIIGLNPILDIKELDEMYYSLKDYCKYFFVNTLNGGRKGTLKQDLELIECCNRLDSENVKFWKPSDPCSNIILEDVKYVPLIHKVNYDLIFNDRFDLFHPENDNLLFCSFDNYIKLLLEQAPYFSEILELENFPCNQLHYSIFRMKDLSDTDKMHNLKEYLQYLYNRFELNISFFEKNSSK